MQRNHEIRAAAGEAKCVRLIHFEHGVRLLEFAKFGAPMAKVDNEVE
jgi:hypothetical protein